MDTVATLPEYQRLGQYRWDDNGAHEEALLLPPEMREDYVWLKVFTREVCARDVDALCERLRQLGFNHDKTTLVKILRGRWNRDAAGVVKPTPVLALSKFRELVEALRSNVRAEQLRGKVPFIRTTVAASIMDYLDLKRAEDRVNKFGIIVGPTGSSKSASFIEYCRLNNHGKCIHVEAPEGGRMTEFISLLATKYGYSPQLNQAAKRNAVLSTVLQGDNRNRSERMILVDNTQDLYRPGQREQPAFSFLRRLQDMSGCTVVLSITPTFERTLVASMMEGYFEQFEGRSGGRRTWLRLPEFPPEEDVVAIAKSFGVQAPKSASKLLVSIGREPGRIRRLFEVLQEAKRISEAEQRPLDAELIAEIRGEA